VPLTYSPDLAAVNVRPHARPRRRSPAGRVIHWQERLNNSGTVHPEVERFAEVIGKLTGGRAERARQFFNWCVVERVVVRDPASLEREWLGREGSNLRMVKSKSAASKR
jgi:hypothetical protein